MFDLKYYREVSIGDKYFDEFKGNCFSRKNLHNVLQKGRKQITETFINDLPDSEDMKIALNMIYNKQGLGVGGVSRFINRL